MTTQPTDIPEVLTRARAIILTNGIHKGDYLPDPLNRRLTTPDAERPMSIDSAIRCAVTGDPRRGSELADAAMAFAAARLTVDGDVCLNPQVQRDCEWHLMAWNDRPHTTARLAASILGRLAEQAEPTVPGHAELAVAA